MKQLVGRSALASCTMNSHQFSALYKFSSTLPVFQHNLQWDFFNCYSALYTEKLLQENSLVDNP